MFCPAFLGGLRPGEIAMIAVLILLLFGAKKIPELMRGVGKGIRGFKEGLNDINDEIKRPVDNPEGGADRETTEGDGGESAAKR